MTKVLIKWFALLIPSFIMSIVGRLLAPILPFFASEDGWLPDWLSWFQTPDNPLDGDRGHKKRWPKNGLFWTYIRRVAWLLRNVCYGFDETVCGIEMYKTDVTVHEGNPDISDVKGISGKCFWRLFRGDKLIGFQWYFVQHYKIWRLKACVRINFGWKLWNPECYHKQYAIYFHPMKKMQWVKD